MDPATAARTANTTAVTTRLRRRRRSVTNSTIYAKRMTPDNRVHAFHEGGIWSLCSNTDARVTVHGSQKIEHHRTITCRLCMVELKRRRAALEATYPKCDCGNPLGLARTNAGIKQCGPCEARTARVAELEICCTAQAAELIELRMKVSMYWEIIGNLGAQAALEQVLP